MSTTIEVTDCARCPMLHLVPRLYDAPLLNCRASNTIARESDAESLTKRCPLVRGDVIVRLKADKVTG